MPTKNSRVIGVRMKLTDIESIQERAKRRGLTVNGWMNWAIKQGLRSHSKQNTKLG